MQQLLAWSLDELRCQHGLGDVTIAETRRVVELHVGMSWQRARVAAGHVPTEGDARGGHVTMRQPTYRPFAHRVCRLRSELELSQVEFARLVGNNRKRIRWIETGRGTLSPLTARKWAQALGQDPHCRLATADCRRCDLNSAR